MGPLACGDIGDGRLADVSHIIEQVISHLDAQTDLVGKNILVTAGPTREFIDPVRFISNPSSGKMGYALARAAAGRGAEVVLVSGPTAEQPPAGVKVSKVTTAVEMLREVMEHYPGMDIIIKAAAVADYRPVSRARQKIKKRCRVTINLREKPGYFGTARRPEGPKNTGGICGRNSGSFKKCPGKVTAQKPGSYRRQ